MRDLHSTGACQPLPSKGGAALAIGQFQAHVHMARHKRALLLFSAPPPPTQEIPMETLPPADTAKPWTLRRARPDDAPAFARMMAVPEVYANLLQLPFPDADTWRTRLAAQQASDKGELHLVADVGGEVV
eukprot:gene61183-83690_t